jgi:hypothetical protein
MKINVEIDCSPSEFKELMVPGEKQNEFILQMIEAANKNNPFAERYTKTSQEVADAWDSARESMLNAWEKATKSK